MAPCSFDFIAALAVANKAIQMVSGFPNWPTPKFLKDLLYQATADIENQYIRVGGHRIFVEAVANEYGPKFKRTIDPMKEVCVSNGASGMIGNIIMAFMNPDDEMIVIEPAFEYYYETNNVFGGKTRYFEMTPPDRTTSEWKIDFTELRKLFNDKTKMIVLNTPQNPTGKVLTEEEILAFIGILRDYPKVIVLSDEVYEYMVFNGNKHLSIGSYPEMWEKTISVYSSGKTFSCTGWRLGFAIGAEKLIKPLIAAQNWGTFCVSTPTQVAVGRAMAIAATEPYEGAKCYYEHLKELFQKKKTELVSILKETKFNWRILEPDGGFFVLADISDCINDMPRKYLYADGVIPDSEKDIDDYRKLQKATVSPDFAFSRYLIEEFKVAALPLSPFYNNVEVKNPLEHRGNKFLRLAVCKDDETYRIVKERLLSQKSI